MPRPGRNALLILFSTLLVLLVLIRPTARAATTFNVNSTGDGADSDPADGVCNDGSGQCTLRAAVEQANQLAGDDVINITVTGTINLSSALPLLSSLTMTGPGPLLLTVRRAPDTATYFRVFRTALSSTVSISGMTITGGRAADDHGGGVYNSQGATLNLSNVVVSENVTDSIFINGSGRGGGIYHDGTLLTLTNSVVSGNSAASGAAGGSLSGRDGGGIYARGTLVVTNSTISGNKAGDRFQGNGLPGNGGGLYLFSGATATLTNSTVSGNRSGSGAGASGGGIANSGGTLTLNNCTVADNTAGSGGGIWGTAINLRNTIVANNTANSNPDLFGTFNSQDFNLIRNVGNATINGTTTHNVTGVDPLLGPLQNDGGPTQTHALLPNSPAIDAGDGGGLTTDQRGLARPVDNASAANASDGSDIGAYEVQSPSPAGQFRFSASTYTAAEAGGAVTITVTRTGGSDGAVNVNYGTWDGTATAGADYQTASGTLSFADGETSKTFSVTVHDDTTDEFDETVRLLLTPGDGSSSILANASLVINDDDLPPALTVSDLSAPEGDFDTTQFVFHVTLSAPSGKPITANVMDASGTAGSGGGDLFAYGGPYLLQFAPGETDKAVTILVRGDLEIEPDEDFFVNVSNVVNASAADTQGRGVILNDDATPTVSLAIDDVSVVEGNTGTTDAVLTVSLSAPTAKTVKVDYRPTGGEGTEIVPFGGTLTFAPGETSKTITVKVLGDLRYEQNEQFGALLTNPRNALMPDNVGLVTIINDEPPPTLSIDDVTVTEGDEGTKTIEFVVSLSVDTESPVSFSFTTVPGTAAENQDYMRTFGASGIGFGVTRRTISVNIRNDTIPEPNETFTVMLSNPDGATIADAEGVCTIIDNDGSGAAPFFQFSATEYVVQESAGEATITVTRSGDLATPATVDYTTRRSNNARSASDRSDYTLAAGTLRFGAGEGFKTFKVLITDDAFAERDTVFGFGDEFIDLSLSNPTGGAALGNPKDAFITIVDNETVTGAQNPIDTPELFVRQHYHDFLNREPDTDGFNFWVGEITQCGTNQQCREVKRVNVSAAFFISIEFQNTGYLVYRFYKTAYGDATSPNVEGSVPSVRLREFLIDTQQIGQGVQVNVGDWEEQLRVNKEAYALDFVRRQRFLTAFPATMTADEFVARLDQNAGQVLSPDEKAQLVASLGSTPADASKRAVVLRQLAENASLRQREFNRAFVLMEYFGYLRRNPDDAPDTDFRGWKFWLDKLNEFNGDFIQAEMVKAFINSVEYRQRFGQ
ncbi:MAG TPA: Calx-beta domain-containing protein [Pyrinomonadaceae bacterium]